MFKVGFHHFTIAWLTKEKYKDRGLFQHLSHHNLLAATTSVQSFKVAVSPHLLIFIYWSKTRGLLLHQYFLMTSVSLSKPFYFIHMLHLFQKLPSKCTFNIQVPKCKQHIKVLFFMFTQQFFASCSCLLRKEEKEKIIFPHFFLGLKIHKKNLLFFEKFCK